MDWILCNLCFTCLDEQPFHFTQCGHVYCQNCISRAQKECVQCGEVNVASLDSTDSENFAKVKHLFQSKFDLQVNLLAMENFQNEQLKIVDNHTDKIFEKYEKLKECFKKNIELRNTLLAKYNKLKIYYTELKTNYQATRNAADQINKHRYRETSPSEMTDSSHVLYTPSMNSDRNFKVSSSGSAPRSILKTSKSLRTIKSEYTASNSHYHPTPFSHSSTPKRVWFPENI